MILRKASFFVDFVFLYYLSLFWFLKLALFSRHMMKTVMSNASQIKTKISPAN